MSAFDDWVLAHVNRGTDMDGAYGSQCWDLFAAYCVEFLGAPNAWVCSTAPSGVNAGYAGSIWEQYPTSDWIAATFDRLGADASPQVGDVAFWGNDPYHPTTHVAIVIEDGVHDGRIHVLAQNVDASMVARDMWDIAATDGYLRPKGGIDMPSAQEIAEAVWNFNQNGVKTRDRLQGIDAAANSAAQAAGRIEGTVGDVKKVIDRNDWRLFRILDCLKKFAGVPKEDTKTTPDLWNNKRLSLIDARVYRLALTIKRFFGVDDKSVDIPDPPRITDAQLDIIADKVVARLKAADAPQADGKEATNE